MGSSLKSFGAHHDVFVGCDICVLVQNFRYEEKNEVTFCGYNEKGIAPFPNYRISLTTGTHALLKTVSDMGPILVHRGRFAWSYWVPYTEWSLALGVTGDSSLSVMVIRRLEPWIPIPRGTGVRCCASHVLTPDICFHLLTYIRPGYEVVRL